MECLNTIDTDGKILSLAVTDNLIFTGHDSCMIKVTRSLPSSPFISSITITSNLPLFDIQVWDARSHVRVASGTAHNWEVWQLALAGGYLFSGSFDHKIVVC